MEYKKKYQNGDMVGDPTPLSLYNEFMLQPNINYDVPVTNTSPQLREANTRNQPPLQNRNWLQQLNQYNNLNYGQFNPFYRPNPAFQTGLAFGVNAPLGAKVGTTFDLLSQSLFTLNNKLQPFLNTIGENQTARTEPTRNKAQAFQNGGITQNPFDPTIMYPNQVTLEGNSFLQQLPPQNQTDFTPFQQETVPQEVQTRATQDPNNLGAANYIGATAAVGSFGMDLAKNIAGGIGVGRRSQYALERAQERMRSATINQGFEKGREEMFNQGYLQTSGYFQDGGTVKPIVVSDPNDPRLKSYQDSLDLWKKSSANFNYNNKVLPKSIDYEYIDKADAELDAENKKILPVKSVIFTNEAENYIVNTPIYMKPNQPIVLQQRPKQELIKNVSTVNPLLNTQLDLSKGMEKVPDVKLSSMFDNTYTSSMYQPASGITGAVRKKGSHEIVAYKGDGKYYPPDTDTKKRPEFQQGGQIPVSLDGLNQFPNQPVIVPSNNITMKGIPYDVMAYPNNNAPQLMKPNQNYNFPNSTQVLEQPMMRNGGMIEVDKGLYYNPTTQEFIQQ